jgi:hypothetical protein
VQDDAHIILDEWPRQFLISRGLGGSLTQSHESANFVRAELESDYFGSPKNRNEIGLI